MTHMNELLTKWESRLSHFRAEVEICFFNQILDISRITSHEQCQEQLDWLRKRNHYECCVRQWERAIEELKEVLNED